MSDETTTLALLEGIYHRREASQGISQEAYLRHDAACRIAAWVSSCWRRRSCKHRPRKRQKKSQKQSIPLHRDTHDYWIMRALCSDSLSVRQVASLLLLKGGRNLELCDLVASTVRSRILTNTTPVGGDYAIQLVGLLNNSCREHALYFVASGGLRWISRRVLELVAMLFPSSNTSPSTSIQSNDLTEQSYSTTMTIQTRLLLLIDLLYRLVLFSSVSSKTIEFNKPSKEEEDKVKREAVAKKLAILTKIHHTFWSTQIPAMSVRATSTELSPLACLVCAHEVLKSVRPLPARIRGMDAGLAMLSRLVDPTCTVMATLSNKSERSSKRKKRDRKQESNTTAGSTAVTTSVAESSSFSQPSRDGDGDAIMEEIPGGGEDRVIDDETQDEDEEHEDEEDEYVEDRMAEEEDEEIDSDVECEEVCEEEEDIVIEDDEEDQASGRHFDDADQLFDLPESAALQVDPLERNAEQSTNEDDPLEKERKRTYIRASMQVLSAHYPQSHQHSSGSPRVTSPTNEGSSYLPMPLLCPHAEQSLLKSVCDVVRPPKKPHNLKIFLKRAPTQEEFFRGSLSRNPVSLSSLARATQRANGGAAGVEPTVRDLRQHIAKDLQMSDSAELLELLVADKILDMNLKLRVVQQVLWKNHLMENSSSSFVSSLLSGQSGHSFLSSSGSGLSMILSAGFGGSGERGGSTRQSVTADTPASGLPPMIVTYRLAGVDGEATEDHVDETNLTDPEAAPPSASAEEHEKQMEKEYGLTRLVTEGRGISVLLSSIESDTMDSLRSIRRDDVVVKRSSTVKKNPSREKFFKAAPNPGLVLLKHCTKLAYNRKKLLEARAPTVLLRLLLDVLNALEGASGMSGKSSGSDASSRRLTNPTADVLKELIELLASDISPSALLETDGKDLASDFESGAEQDASTLPLLLSSLKTTFLSPSLRKVIGKLLPFLTYGQVSLSKELAENVAKHVTVENIRECKADNDETSQVTVLVDTFVQTTISLPANDICNSLRVQLISCGFVERIAEFCTRELPSQPPPWSPALWSKEDAKDLRPRQRKSLGEAWRVYFCRDGLRTAFRMLTGLCAGHCATQSLIADFEQKLAKGEGKVSLLAACHWIENTSDNAVAKVNMNGMGILAETLLDEVMVNNDVVSEKVKALRKETRERKKEIAEERRSRALVGMSSFGPLTGSAAAGDRASPGRNVASSLLAPVIGFFRDQTGNANSAGNSNTASLRSETASRSERPRRSPKKSASQKPSWLAEMEAMEDETGLTCAVCQEGRKLQPTELLGLYTYVKKVSIPMSKCGARGQLDGTMLLVSLPMSLPESLQSTHVDHEYFQPAKAVADSLRGTPHASSTVSSSFASSKRPSQFVTTVSAGNAIHCSCHAKARSADRNHPKAPKSEWEGASLRNSRIQCNAILPLVSSSSKVNLAAVEIALTDYQTVISNMLGSRPKSIMWAILHDVRFLLLRIAYGEALNSDCGGGSLSSNTTLMFHEMFMADSFAKEAEHSSPETAQHARFLSAGFIAAYEILHAEDFDQSSSSSSTLSRSIAESAPMAALCCILFNNGKDDDVTVPGKDRRWGLHKEKFLCGLIACAGRRFALGVNDSGCINSRGNKRAARLLSSSFADWDVVDDESSSVSEAAPSSSSKRKASSFLGKRGYAEIDEYATALRPMITFFAIMDQLSECFEVQMTDEAVEESALKVVKTIETCQRTKSIHELLNKAKVTLDHEKIVDELQKGIASV